MDWSQLTIRFQCDNCGLLQESSEEAVEAGDTCDNCGNASLEPWDNAPDVEARLSRGEPRYIDGGPVWTTEYQEKKGD